MVRQRHRLNMTAVKRITEKGLHADGGGLYLQVTDHGSKSWVYRFMLVRHARTMGLGSAESFNLSEARQRAEDCRKLCALGIDPIEHNRAKRIAASKTGISLADCAAKFIAEQRPGWRNAKHAAQWTSTINTYVKPLVGELAVEAIGLVEVRRVLDPIWTRKPETASRVRGRLEAILDWATVQGLRTGDNPARWRGHLDKLLLPRSRVAKVEHHPALPYQEVAAFLTSLSGHQGATPRAFKFLILTAVRTSEALNAKWSEVNLGNGIWTIPPERMKANQEHRVPLSTQALEIVKKQKKCAEGEYLFPGSKKGRPLSNMAMLQLLKRMDRTDITPHGFRSTFRDWASEETDHSSDVVEKALAHTIKSKVEAAYRRGDLFEKRRVLMEDWAKQCQPASNNA